MPIPTVTQRDLKKSKDLVEKLLKVKGESYQNWLHAQHQQFIEGNQDLILEALTLFVEEEKGSSRIPEDKGTHSQSSEIV
ncbi:hypothetical protein IIU_06806 [Bacillus cereus VD133]|uniref:Uncharacterized protein n=1 Tax=Bacillus cereus VD133 TaxID=1053233 RepID=A0A9W5UZ07_BACCE|nr:MULTISPECIES: hypothetical protein [Bacillus cereus group]PES00710.1 hypothetical protein CN488_31000 [Bacillus anthracis]PGT62720.1 hypothetical protein COD14_22980 [Bacillus cereus]EOO24171.1 hypothetical protein IIU_06806 [Bacillus cereus VD133]PEZ16588.1 hypothetical protein CN345_30780 [Bacillus thuringiensis]PGV99529.1 hypothetical protein COD86_02315 [Bacillus cereus]